MGEGALFLTFCQMSRTPARIARMPMPRHAGEGVSAAVEMPSRVLSPMVKAVERMRATTQGRTPERKASTPAYLSRSWMRAAMSRMMKKDGRTLSQIASLMRVYPQVLLNVRGDREKLKALKGDPSLQKRQQELEEQMQANGRILVRPSGTEPVVRIMVEGPEEKMIMDIAKAMEQTIIERLGQDENC